MKLTYAFCTYNRANRLERLVAAMRTQRCPIPFEILAVNNASTDHTEQILNKLKDVPGPPLRVVTESNPGIVPARNRALEESLDSEIMVFIDDDEIPRQGLLNAVVDAILNQGADCVGGRVIVNLGEVQRPSWLDDNLLGFLAQVDYGDKPFWIKDSSTPLWTANIAYSMRIFRNNPGLRFDPNYNREGKDIGGGEDAIMFRTMIERGYNILYRPDMVVEHEVEPWRINPLYFLKLHYKSGLRTGMYQLPEYQRTLLGVPPFLVRQFLIHLFRTLACVPNKNCNHIRQSMNASHAFGMIIGYIKKH